MKTYDISFRNEKENSYRLLIFFLVVIHVVVFTYLLFTPYQTTGIIGLAITLLYILYRWLITNTAKQKFSFGHGIFFLYFICLIWNTWLVAIDGLFEILSVLAIQHKAWHFNRSFIEHRSFPFRKYKWDQLDNVILKDNILTLDFKNNKLIQGYLDNPIDEQAFNTFAKEHLHQ